MVAVTSIENLMCVCPCIVDDMRGGRERERSQLDATQ